MGSFSLSLRPKQQLRHEIRLTAVQRLALLNYIQGMRIELAGALAGVVYSPDNSCPVCHRELKLVEILRGYSDNPQDLRTKCPKCGTLFVAMLKSDRAELTWYCPAQTLFELSQMQRLHGRSQISPDEILKKNQSVYHSTLTHFGNFKKAFSKIGIDYKCDEPPKWREKIEVFLGKLPDTVIAEIVGVKKGVINRIRVSAKIPPFNRRDKAEGLA